MRYNSYTMIRAGIPCGRSSRYHSAAPGGATRTQATSLPLRPIRRDGEWHACPYFLNFLCLSSGVHSTWRRLPRLASKIAEGGLVSFGKPAPGRAHGVRNAGGFHLPKPGRRRGPAPIREPGANRSTAPQGQASCLPARGPIRPPLGTHEGCPYEVNSK